MSINLQQYFKLGTDTTNDAMDTPAIIQTYRTPTDTVSSLHNKVTIKLPKRGLLTKDSMIIVTPQLNGTFTGTNYPMLNTVNGILGSIKRCTLLIDSKPLVDLEQPSFLETNKLYSRFTTAHLQDYHKFFLGNNFALETNETSSSVDGTRGQEQFKKQHSVMFDDKLTPSKFVSHRDVIGVANKRYGIYLYQLGFNFLKYNSLPVYLMKDREIELQIEFDTDCRNWCFTNQYNGNNVVELVSNDVGIALQDVELVSVHVLLDEEVEAEQRAMLQQNQVEYNLIESYLIRGTTSRPYDDDTTKQTELYRLNLQNREVHKVLTAFRQVNMEEGTDNPLANQRAIAFGDETLNYRVNGTFVFDDDISNDALMYYLNSLYNNGNGLKVSPHAWSNSKLVISQGLADSNTTDFYRGSFHYIGQDFKTNPGVFGGGIGFKVPLDIEYSYVNGAVPDAKLLEHDALFYISASKMLRISANSVMISF